MRILIEGENLENYLAKCHEAFRTGLRAFYDTRCFGKGYLRYSPFVKTFGQIQKKMFPDRDPDLLIAETWFPRNLEWGFKYHGIENIRTTKVVTLRDFWSEAEKQLDRYIDFIEMNQIHFILSLFPQPLTLWKDTPLGNRLLYIPPTFDPKLFNDWQMPKTYDVGFLAAGTVEKVDFYPERYNIHQKILQRKDLFYLWAKHPGWKMYKNEHALVGKNFSKLINSCKIFITTGGIYRNPQPKIFESLASRTLLMSDEPVGVELIGLEDGVNYVKITEDSVMDKIDYYLSRPEERESIAENGFQLAMRRHSCYARALDFYKAIQPRL